MNTDLAQRGVALLSKVVAARMVLLRAFARAVKLQRLGGCTCTGARLGTEALVATWLRCEEPCENPVTVGCSVPVYCFRSSGVRFAC